MFIVIPLVLILGSAAAVSVIIGRKFSFLKKLNPEAHQAGDNIFVSFFPELVDEFKKIKFKEHWHTTLVELEKFLRRLRVWSLKVDQVVDGLIKKIRKTHITMRHDSVDRPAAEVEAGFASRSPGTVNDGSNVGTGTVGTGTLKKEEQELIIQIAKDPKAAGLYEKLGDVYAKMGNSDDALESYSTALKLDPDNNLLKNKQASIKSSQSNTVVVK